MVGKIVQPIHHHPWLDENLGNPLKQKTQLNISAMTGIKMLYADNGKTLENIFSRLCA